MKWFLVIFIAGVVSLQAQAQQPTGDLFLNPYAPEFDSPYDLEIMDANLYNDLVKFTEHRDRVQNLILAQLPDNGGLVPSNSYASRRIMDRTSRRFMKTEYFRNSLLGKAGESIKSHTEADIAFTDEMNRNHKFDFKLAAFQRQIFIQYSGFTKTQLRYDLHNGGSAAIIFQHDLSKFSSIGIESTFTGGDRYQLLTLNVVW